MSLSREQTVNARPHLKTADVDASEVVKGETLRVRELTARERWVWGRMSGKATEDEKQPDPLSFMVTMCAVDESGGKLYQAQDVDFIQNLPGSFVGRVTDKCMELSGLSKSTDEAVDEAGEDSSETVSVSSSSDSDGSSDVSPTS